MSHAQFQGLSDFASEKAVLLMVRAALANDLAPEFTGLTYAINYGGSPVDLELAAQELNALDKPVMCDPRATDTYIDVRCSSVSEDQEARLREELRQEATVRMEDIEGIARGRDLRRVHVTGARGETMLLDFGLYRRIIHTYFFVVRFNSASVPLDQSERAVDLSVTIFPYFESTRSGDGQE